MRRATAIFVLAAFPSTAFAQTGLPQAGEAMNGDPCAAARCTTEPAAPLVLDFEGDEVNGTLVKPDELNVHPVLHGKASSLIEIRADFIPELITSVEDI